MHASLGLVYLIYVTEEDNHHSPFLCFFKHTEMTITIDPFIGIEELLMVVIFPWWDRGAASGGNISRVG